MAIISSKEFFGDKKGTVVESAGAPPIPIPSKAERKTLWENLQEEVSGTADKTTDTLEAALTGKQNLGSTAVQVGGQALQQVLSPVTAGAKTLVSKIPKDSAIAKGASAVGGAITGAFDFLTEDITNNPKFQEFANSDAGQELARSMDAMSGYLGIVPVGEGIKAGTTLAKETAQAGVQAGKAGAEAISDATGAIVDATKGAVDVAKMAGEGAMQIPKRIATNVADKRVAEEAIRQLPTRTAQQAARDGIEVADVKEIYKIPESAKPQAKALVDNVRKFANKETDVDPIETVGKPIIARMKQMESEAGTVGQKLGEVADNLGVVTKAEVEAPVFNALKGVRGLQGLTVDKDGVLNFKNTVLTTAETASDRKAIQSIFTQATQWGSGGAKHKLRQELFEILGGKKKAGVQLTDTQDKAYQAIRQGLSDVLDAKNPQYKELNTQYAKLAQPLNDLRRAIKAAHPDMAEDILDMNAGLLARRLTSTSMSQGEIRRILDAMDETGALRESTEASQKLYNILGKYYDIAPKTGFQNQVRAGIESAGGVSEAIMSTVKGLAGETPAVRQKALEDLLNEIFQTPQVGAGI